MIQSIVCVWTVVLFSFLIVFSFFLLVHVVSFYILFMVGNQTEPQGWLHGITQETIHKSLQVYPTIRSSLQRLVVFLLQKEQETEK